MTNDEMHELMNTYSGYLLQLSYMYVKDWAAAEDVVQESFIKYFKNPQQFERRAHIKTYLSKIVIHTSHDYIRSWKSRTKLLSKMFSYQMDPVEEAVEQTELLKFVLTLPLKYREVITLFYYEDLTSAEIAALLGMSENTVKTRLRRGRELLKTTLSEEDWEAFRYE